MERRKIQAQKKQKLDECGCFLFLVSRRTLPPIDLYGSVVVVHYGNEVRTRAPNGSNRERDGPRQGRWRSPSRSSTRADAHTHTNLKRPSVERIRTRKLGDAISSNETWPSRNRRPAKANGGSQRFRPCRFQSMEAQCKTGDCRPMRETGNNGTAKRKVHPYQGHRPVLRYNSVGLWRTRVNRSIMVKVVCEWMETQVAGWIQFVTRATRLINNATDKSCDKTATRNIAHTHKQNKQVRIGLQVLWGGNSITNRIDLLQPWELKNVGNYTNMNIRQNSLRKTARPRIMRMIQLRSLNERWFLRHQVE